MGASAEKLRKVLHQIQIDTTHFRPQTRLVAAELETRWNAALAGVADIEVKIVEHDAATPSCPDALPASFATLAEDLKAVWIAPATDARLKERIVRTVIREVTADIDEGAGEIVLTVHWAGGVHTERRLPKRRRGQRNSTPPTFSPPSGRTTRSLLSVLRQKKADLAGRGWKDSLSRSFRWSDRSSC